MRTFPPEVNVFTQTQRPRQIAHKKLLGSLSPGEDRIDLRSPARFVLWLLNREWQPILVTGLLGVLWALPGSLNPYLIGRAIDVGIIGQDLTAAIPYLVGMFALVLVATATGALQGWFEILSWNNTSFAATKISGRKVNQLGHVLARRTPTGEVLSVATSDPNSFGALAVSTGMAIANLASIGIVVVLILTQSLVLGLVVLCVTPLLLGVSAPFLKSMQRAQSAERSRNSKLTGMATDIVAGLRILRGIGGETTFGSNYARQSQHTRKAGVILGTWMAFIMALSTLLAGWLLVGLTGLGATELLNGRLSVGQLVSFFGYATFLVHPMQSLFDFVQKFIAAYVSGRKTIAVLRSEVPWITPADPKEWIQGATLVDDQSRLEVPAGKMTVVVAQNQDDSAALLIRLGRYLPLDGGLAVSLNLTESTKGKKARNQYRLRDQQRKAAMEKDARVAEASWRVRIGDVDLTDIDLDEVRKHILVSDPNSMVFSGTLQNFIDPHNTHDRLEAEQALIGACAEDVYQLMSEGWQGHIDERGRDLSGGQRQRLVLARALLLDPEILALVEPTSAVDAHTEARIATRLASRRKGKTTVISSISPLWLHKADQVALLVGEKIVASGTHEQLLNENKTYREIVVRDWGESDRADSPQTNPPADFEQCEGKTKGAKDEF